MGQAVAVKVFTHFRKVRIVTKDVRIITRALQQSTLLSLSDDGKKVRRVHAAPNGYNVEDIQKRTVIVEDMQLSPTIGER